MNPSFLGVLVMLGLVVVGWRLARRKPRSESEDRIRRPERRVEGFQVWSPLHLRIGRSCLFDYGLQYGPGFRRKEGPLLPHDPHCHCETLPFNLTASEVFAGGLRRIGEPKSLETGFPLGAITQTLTALKRINAEPLPGDVEAYLALVGMDAFSPADHDAVDAFLRERYAFLTHPEHVTDSPSSRSSDDGRAV
jgi:hypothetical protein